MPTTEINERREEMARTATSSRVEEARPFAEVFPDLLRDYQQLPLGRINLRTFFAEIPGWDYSTLRRMVAGDITIQPAAIEEMAKVLGVSPRLFLEYRLFEVCEILRANPRLVSLVYDQVMAESEVLHPPGPRGNRNKTSK